jgi:ferredoxin
MKRETVIIDENKCDGCGDCVPGCPEGALQVIDGKVRLISGSLCDGLGVCIGECPRGAITVKKMETEAYDEGKVMDNIVKQGENTLRAHLKHLHGHGQSEYLQTAISYLEDRKMKIPRYRYSYSNKNGAQAAGGCPGSRILDFTGKGGHTYEDDNTGKQPSALRQWPVQMHLVSPSAPYFNGADLLFAADCTAFAIGDFHSHHLKGKALAIGCPKLDAETVSYVEKLTAMIDDAKINTLTVMTMEVPCCGGLLQISKEAAAKAKRKVPVKAVRVSLKGEIMKEEWL